MTFEQSRPLPDGPNVTDYPGSVASGAVGTEADVTGGATAA